MVKIVNTKILLGIFAVLIAISGLLYKQAQDQKAAAAAAVQAALILKQQQAEQQAERDRYAELARRVNADKQKQIATKKQGSKVWTTYLP